MERKRISEWSSYRVAFGSMVGRAWGAADMVLG